jgi:hypothetical protein
LKAQLPVIDVLLDGKSVSALVDSGCSRTIVLKRLVKNMVDGSNGTIMAVDGKFVKCGLGCVNLMVNGIKLDLQCLVMDSILFEVEVILGMDVIRRLGGVTFGDATGGVVFGGAAIVVDSKNLELDRSIVGNNITIEDVDFRAVFDGERWTVGWNWSESEPSLENHVAAYYVKDEILNAFEQEIEEWISDGILEPVPTGIIVKSLLPLMAVDQSNKGKVRPVLDFRRVNDYVSSHSGSSAVCDDTIRRWRKEGLNTSLVDLRKAYLQVHVDRDLWKHQVVRYKNKNYYLTRLGFGLNCAPKVMSTILGKVLAMDPNINAATSHYIDDIMVNEDKVSVTTPSKVRLGG